ncbi:MAG: hypothetical protein ACYDCM_05530 [Candidatus Acidiferrales bacterium]
MPRRIAGRTVGRIVAGGFALLLLVATVASAQSPSASPAGLKKKYPEMAPIDEYLMDRDAEIALARSAAPDAISKDASVLVLTRTGWETAVKGTNGFVCNVERGWASGIYFSATWNPKMRGPDCLNAAAARSILPIEYKFTQMTLAGVHSEKDRLAAIKAAYAKKEFHPLEPGAMGYMMSKKAYLTNQGGNLSHVMFFLPTRKASDLGANLPHVPIASVSYWFPDPEENPLDQELPPLRFFVVAVPRWSDGTSVLAK